MTDDIVENIIDRIDELVDHQLAQPIVDDYNVNRYPKCPHCQRHWHGLPVTENIAAMYSRAQFDEGYRVDTDDSRILCRGSDFIGPMPSERPNPVGSVSDSWLDRIRRGITPGIPNPYDPFIGPVLDDGPGWRELAQVNGYDPSELDRRCWWRTELPLDAQVIYETEFNTVIIRNRDHEQTFTAEDIRVAVHNEAEEVMMIQSNRPVRFDTITRIIVDTLSATPPRLACYTERLTRHGITTYPDDRRIRGFVDTVIFDEWPRLPGDT
jgi:hypothetical protein